MSSTTLEIIDYDTLRPLPLVKAFAPSYSQRPTCRKHTYWTKRDSLTARNAAFNRRHKRPEFLRAYACHHCQGWHLTHQPLRTDV